MRNSAGWIAKTVPSLTGRCVFALMILSVTASAAQDQSVQLTRLRHEVRELLRYEAKLDEGSTKDAAVAALCDLYVVLRCDDRYPASEMLQSDAAKLRRRLLSTARKREQRLNRQQISRPSGLSSKVDAAVAKAIAEASDGPTERNPLAGGAAMDNGWELVELIQRIIAPDFWDRQGGPGTIRYFAMRRVLVVRATSDVHQQIKDLLIALR